MWSKHLKRYKRRSETPSPPCEPLGPSSEAVPGSQLALGLWNVLCLGEHRLFSAAHQAAD